MKTLIKLCDENVENGDFETLRHKAHSLKGAVRNLGLEEMLELAYEIENIVKRKMARLTAKQSY